MQIELVEQDSSSHHTVIQVVGVGGGGSNAVRRMIQSGLDGVEFIMANTDLQALKYFQLPKLHTLPLGEKITGGLGAGGSPEVGCKAAQEDVEKIRELLAKAHMVFVTAGMGGGTGTGAAPVIAQVAKEMDKLCVAVVTTPFHFEGRHKLDLAQKGLEELRKNVDTLIVIPNQLLLESLNPSTSVREAFQSADEVLRMGVKGIADLITQPGDINVDFNDVRTIMRKSGKALMGIGSESGEGRASEATRQALENPLLSRSKMLGATGLLVQITADQSFSLSEYESIMEKINAYVDTEQAKVISGIAIDDQKKDEIKVTVIATGFHAEPELPPQNPAAESNNVARGYVGQSSGMQSPLEAPLSTPMGSTPMGKSGKSGRPLPKQALPGQAVSKQVYERPHGRAESRTRQEPYREAGQATQMRQALQPGELELAEVPDRVIYQVTDEDNRLVEEQQVSETELQLLFSGKENEPSVGRSSFGQKRAEPQLPPGPNEDLYVPALLRRKQRKR